MGQGQSQPQAARPATPEPDIGPEERIRLQAEERERRAAAAQQRVNNQQKKKTTAATGGREAGGPPRKKTALEQASAENVGWRNADAQAELRAWN